jgi:alkylation response protein AidB-like acyl-CoA dehydrogenase
MDFNFTDEQVMLRDTIAAYLADHYDFETRRAVVKTNAGWRPQVWKAFAEELGILGAAFTEAQGGLGGGVLENLVVMEEFGKALVTEPYLDAVVIAGGFIKHGPFAGGDALAGEIIAGTAIPVFAYAEPQGRYNWADLKTTAKTDGDAYILNGHKAVVTGGPYATHFIVTVRTSGGQRDRDGVSVLLVDKASKGIVTRDYPTVDGQAASEVFFENVSVPAANLIGVEGQGLALVERVIDEAAVASMAEACGVLTELHKQTMDYTKQRQQFGQAIGEFQVIQHRLVDMFIQVQLAVSMTYMASMKVDTDDAKARALVVSSAKVQVARSLKFVGEQAIQLHGGMGMTEELAISHYFKRATILRGLFGSEDHHMARYEQASFGKAA